MASATNREQIKLSENAQITSFGFTPSESAPTSCILKRGAKGSVVARYGEQSLVVFNEGDWRGACKERGLGGQPMGWVSDSALKQEPRISTEGLNKYGDRCAAYEFIESNLKTKAPKLEAGTSECKDNCAQKSPLLDLAAQMLEMGAFHDGNRCLIEGRSANESDVDCSFDAMMKEVHTCQGRMAEADRNRCIGRCVNKLYKMACEMSPWKEKTIEERFQLIMKLGEEPARHYGVDARMMPCIGIVET
ncbi:MAG: hypothetical protein KDD43_17035, partial [Bdellovibrionales bacterium]|nr:hypothetical protein [Bdellovibrionales bacterium]